MWFKQIRRLAKLMHRCLGVLLMAVLLLSCVTGVVLLFKAELDQWVNADMMLLAVSEPNQATALSLEQIEQRIQQRYPNSRVSWFDLQPSHQQAAVYWLAGLTDPETGQYIAPEHNQIFIDLSTGEILGGRRWGDWHSPLVNLVPLIYQLHYSLLAGGVGANLLGIACVFWFVQIVLGIYLTWPKGRASGLVARGRKWLGYWRFRQGKSQFQDHYFRHRWLGLWLSPMMLVLILSGLSFNLKPIYFGLSDLIFERQTAHLHLPISSQGQRYPMSVDQALQQGQYLMSTLAGQEQFQVIHPIGLSYSPYNGHYLYRVYSSLDTSNHYARTSVWFDGHNGQVQAVYWPTGKFAVDGFTSWISALHMGKAGTWSVWLLLISMMGLLYLMVASIRLLVKF